MKIFVINGLPMSGKDTFVSLCQKHLCWCKNISTVDFVKEVAKFCGWDGEKTPKNRAFLSDLKDLLTQWNDVPFEKIKEEIRRYATQAQCHHFSEDDVIVFIHCREPQEIQRFVEELGAETLLVRRAAVENNHQSNHADSDVFNYQYDYTITNDGTIEELEDAAIDFLWEIGFGDKVVRYQ